MKYKLMLILCFVLAAYSQFSSGTDYSVKEQKESNGIGTVFHFEKSETEWKLNYGTENSFTARSDLFGYGYGIFGKYIADDLTVHYRADHILRTITGSVTSSIIDTSSVTTNMDLNDIAFQNFDSEIGLLFQNTYGLYGNILYYSFDDSDETAFQYGLRGEYTMNFKSSNSLKFMYGFNVSDDEEILNAIKSITEIDPQSIFGALFTIVNKSSKFYSGIKYFTYDKSTVSDKDKEYINAELKYDYSFTKANSVISANIGLNLTSGFDLPEIYIPFFYNGLEFENKLFDEKISLIIGWKYRLTNSLLSDRNEFSSAVPDDLSIEDIKDNTADNKLYIKLGYRF